MEYDAIISAGPCIFCDWDPKSSIRHPDFAYSNDGKDVILFCPKCGIEIIGQTKVED